MGISMVMVSKTWRSDMPLPAAEPLCCIEAIWTPLLHRVGNHGWRLAKAVSLSHSLQKHKLSMFRSGQTSLRLEILAAHPAWIWRWPPVMETRYMFWQGTARAISPPLKVSVCPAESPLSRPVDSETSRTLYACLLASANKRLILCGY